MCSTDSSHVLCRLTQKRVATTDPAKARLTHGRIRSCAPAAVKPIIISTPWKYRIIPSPVRNKVLRNAACNSEVKLSRNLASYIESFLY